MVWKSFWRKVQPKPRMTELDALILWVGNSVRKYFTHTYSVPGTLKGVLGEMRID